MYSVQVATSDGTLTHIALSIEYFEKDDITLYRDLELVPLVLDTDYRWDSDTRIELLTNIPVVAGGYITVRRNTNIDRAFNIYDGGAAFSRETLDENFSQVIYLAQEFTEGNGLTGLFFPLDMHNFQIKNLGDGTLPGDAVNKKQLDVVDARVDALEDTYINVTSSYPWYTTTTTSTDTLVPGLTFTKAALYINGVCQIPEYSYVVVSDTILMAQEVPAGTVVFARLGEDVPNESGWATTTQLTSLQTSLQTDIDSRLESTENLADLSNVAAARTNLALGAAAVLNVGLATGTVADGGVVNGLVQKVRKKMEVYYSGLSLAIPTTATNFINLVKVLTPTSGTLNSFFNTTSNKLNVYNDNTSVLFKVNIVGSWTTASQSRSMVLDFAGTQGNRLTINRVDSTTPDTVQFSTYFSVDANGNLVTNGSAPSIQSNGSVFTATAILITVEQITGVSSIVPV